MKPTSKMHEKTQVKNKLLQACFIAAFEKWRKKTWKSNEIYDEMFCFRVFENRAYLLPVRATIRLEIYTNRSMNMKFIPLMLVLSVLSSITAVCQDKDPSVTDEGKYTTTASGLQYMVIREGDGGPHPGRYDNVEVHYKGMLQDGTEFDSSYSRGVPTNFRLDQVIPGWTEGVQLMTCGAKFRFIVPSEMAYGERGRPPKIPPNSTLTFEIELQKIRKGPDVPKFKKGNPKVQKKTESGLVYEPLIEGQGDIPTEGEMVQVKYAFWNMEGELGDCNELHSRDLKFVMGKMELEIFEAGVGMLKEGSRYRFEVPPELAFGEKGGGRVIPPNSKCVWELELVRIVKPLPVPEFVVSAPEKLKTTDSGLKYEVIKEGENKDRKPLIGHMVTVHYAGWLEDGTLFDSSYERGDTASFRLGRVIPGWNEGLQLMEEGAIYRFIIPGDLAYGEQGSPPKIPSNATLIFYIELHGISY